MTSGSSGKPPLRGLGRGLDALLPAKAPPPVRTENASYGEGNVFRCALDKVVPQPGQPRHHFDTEKLEELAQSLKEHGLIEPLVVRKRPGTDLFEIIAGERRWRAAQRAGLHEVLVVVRDVSAQNAFELAIIENVQREDLDPIEFAEAIQRLLDEHAYTQESLAERLGKDRSTIANALRLLKLPPKVRELVVEGELTEGHARALLGASDEKALAQLADKVIKGKLSVRQTEALVRTVKSNNGKNGSATNSPGGKTASVRDLEHRLTRQLGTRCEVIDKAGKGEIRITYSSLDELDRLLEVLL